MSYAPYFWSEPDRLPADLPSHENWIRDMPFRVAGKPSPHPPRTAPGFERAGALGLCPDLPPATPPAPLPGLNSMHYALLAAAQVLVFIGANGVFQNLGGDWRILGLPLGLLIFVTGAWNIRVVARRSNAEEAAGYTHLWAQLGLWRLSPITGEATREPDRTIAPPGFYPSPYFPGVLQYWDGPDWKPLGGQWYRPNRIGQYFRRPAVDFLGLGNVELASDEDTSTNPTSPFRRSR